MSTRASLYYVEGLHVFHDLLDAGDDLVHIAFEHDCGCPHCRLGTGEIVVTQKAWDALVQRINESSPGSLEANDMRSDETIPRECKFTTFGKLSDGTLLNLGTRCAPGHHVFESFKPVDGSEVDVCSRCGLWRDRQ
jgi:hypothetical protein